MNGFSCGNNIAAILPTINYGVNFLVNSTGSNVSVNVAANYIGSHAPSMRVMHRPK